MLQDVIKLYQDCQNFIILGYSFGSLLALKIASKLESIGLRGKMIFIDGSPKFLTAQYGKYILKDYSDSDIQNLLLVASARKVYGVKSEKIMKSVMEQTSWEEKIKIFEESYLSLNEEEMKFLHTTATLKAVFYRIKMILTIDSMQFPVLQRTPIILVKASDSAIKIEDDYGLKKYSRSKIETYTIEGNHLSMLTNDKIIKLLNLQV